MHGIRGKMLGRPSKRSDLSPAISELGISLETVKNNEPINRKEGDIRQADLERKHANSFKSAIKVLKIASRK